MILIRNKLPRLAHSHLHNFVQAATELSVHQLAAPNEGEEREVSRDWTLRNEREWASRLSRVDVECGQSWAICGRQRRR